jgi:hypothetical protein
MTWSLDRTTDTGKGRVLITGESVEATSVFTDEDIEDVLLAIEPTVLEAAALGLERIAGDSALLLRKVRDSDPTADVLFGAAMSLDVGTISLDAKGAAEAFLKLAARYRAAAAESSSGVEDETTWAGMVLNPEGWAEAIWNDALRTTT